jgi:hypothetical protein
MPNNPGNQEYPKLINAIVRSPTKIMNEFRGLNTSNTQMLTNFNTTFVPTLDSAYVVDSGSVVFQYKKSKGAKIIGIEIEPQYSYDCVVTKSFYTNISIPSGAIWLNSSSYFASTVPTGSRLINQPQASQRIPSKMVEYINVENCLSSSILVFTASWHGVKNVLSASSGHGFSRINAFELPRKTYLDNSSDVGITSNPTYLLDSYVSSSTENTINYGVQRIVNQLYTFKDESPSQVNHSFMHDANRRWILKREYSSVSGSFVYGQNVYSVSTVDRKHYLRVNNTYGTADTTKPFKFSIAYETADSVAAYSLYVNVRPSGSVGYTQHTISLPSSVGGVSFYEQTIEFPTNGISQVAEYFFEGQASEKETGELYIHNIFMHENNVI